MTRWDALVAVPILMSFIVGGLSAHSAQSTVPPKATTWTIMMYMADDFSSSLDWQQDFNELEAALQDPGTSIIALVDEFGPGNSAIFEIAHDPNFLDPSIVSERVNDSGAVIAGSEVNMAAASTLEAFIEFSATEYQADYYVLVLWGHGAGWRGLCPDGTDLLTISELGDALSNSTATMTRKLDIVVIDSCAEAALETLSEIRDSVRLFVASEKDVPFQGLPYVMVMNDLAADPGQSIEEFASNIAEDYVAWSSSNTDYSVTMGVFDLAKMDSLMASVDALSVQGSKYDPIFHDVLRETYNSSERYEDLSSVDFRHFMLGLQDADLPLEIRYWAARCLIAAEGFVVHFTKYDNPVPVNGVHVERASGFTIYAPGSSSSDDAYGNLSLATTQWPGFGRLMRNDTVTIPNGPGPTVTYSSSMVLALSSDDPPISRLDTARLDWPDGITAGTIWVFRSQTGGIALDSIRMFTGQDANLTGIIGPLTLATSSFTASKLTSYSTVNITLEGTTTLIVQVTKNGQPEDYISRDFEISAIASSGKALDQIHSPEGTMNDRAIFMASIPEQAVPGEIVTIEVLDKSTNEVVGTKKIFLSSDSVTVDVEVFTECECPYRFVVPLFLALFPGLLILGFALSLHYQNRKEERGKTG